MRPSVVPVARSGDRATTSRAAGLKSKACASQPAGTRLLRGRTQGLVWCQRTRFIYRTRRPSFRAERGICLCFGINEIKSRFLGPRSTGPRNDGNRLPELFNEFL
jgi:hypothetical protein